MEIQTNSILVKFIFVYILIRILIRIDCASLTSQYEKSREYKTEFLIIEMTSPVFKIDELERSWVRYLHARVNREMPYSYSFEVDMVSVSQLKLTSKYNVIHLDQLRQ